MIQVGDYVRMKREYIDQTWYTEDAFKVIDVFKDDEDNILSLDKFYETSIFSTILSSNKIYEHVMVVDFKMTRSNKIKEIINDTGW